ncbi:type I toxin-antitoxin system Fst family toxin [Streptococcus equi]|nr:type I toxin-antitoxin system Fst family toxin [Streptococcus pneumoniae]HEM6116788.1 type I toxin-antitoxin system Fst family toxin [Streptococcus suis]
MLLLVFTALVAPVLSGIVIALFEYWLNHRNK